MRADIESVRGRWPEASNLFPYKSGDYLEHNTGDYAQME
jgi:hypothetical protein